MMLYKSKVKKRLEEVLSIFPRNTNLFMEYVLSLKVRILDKKNNKRPNAFYQH